MTIPLLIGKQQQASAFQTTYITVAKCDLTSHSSNRGLKDLDFDVENDPLLNQELKECSERSWRYRTHTFSFDSSSSTWKALLEDNSESSLNYLFRDRLPSFGDTSTSSSVRE